MERTVLILLVSIALLVTSCQKENGELVIEQNEPYLLIPEGFPSPEFPEDNAFTDARWELGKKLFFDPVMSRNQEISCASCHLPSFAFSDTVSFSPGVDGSPGTRNAPSLANVAYHPYYTREGGVPSLEMQVLVPIQEHNEFDFNILEIAERLDDDPDYQKMAQLAYNREPDHYVITRALATFERSMISGNSPYDKYHFQNDKTALTDQQIKGMELFYSDKTNCFSCHSGFNFTDYGFANNGLYNEYIDNGRFRLTKDESDRALFKIPTLRNAGITGPYMHDGSMKTLEDVVSHYNSGGQNHPHKSPLIKALHLTDEEQNALVTFLKSLTDQSFIENEKFKP